MAQAVGLLSVLCHRGADESEGEGDGDQDSCGVQLSGWPTEHCLRNRLGDTVTGGLGGGLVQLHEAQSELVAAQAQLAESAEAVRAAAPPSRPSALGLLPAGGQRRG
jgi:hypothetical protein